MHTIGWHYNLLLYLVDNDTEALVVLLIQYQHMDSVDCLTIKNELTNEKKANMRYVLVALFSLCACCYA